MENPKKSDAGAAVSEEYGLSKDRIARYLRIATLITPLLDCLDAKTLGFEAAYDISFVKEEMQPVIAELIVNDNCRIDTKKSILIHDYAKKGKLTEELLRQIITGEKRRLQGVAARNPSKSRRQSSTDFWQGAEQKGNRGYDCKGIGVLFRSEQRKSGAEGWVEKPILQTCTASQYRH